MLIKNDYKAEIKKGFFDSCHFVARATNDLPLKHSLEDLGDSGLLLEFERQIVNIAERRLDHVLKKTK